MNSQNTEYETAENNIPENDVVEMDFPEYTEEIPPIGGTIAGTSFSEEKMEIYRRNREIAAEMQSEILAAREQKKADKIAEFESIYEESEAAANFAPKLNRRSFTALIIVFGMVLAIVIAPMLVILNIQSSMEFSRTQAVAESASETASIIVISETEAVTRAETEMIVTEEITEETTEIPVEILKTTAVREPFEESGTALVYNTEAMSYRFEPHCKYYNDKYWIDVYVTVKNLTDFEYIIIPDFNITLGKPKKDNVFLTFSETGASVFDSSSQMLSFNVEEFQDGEWTKTKRENIAYNFGNDHLCSFTLQFFVEDYYVLKNFVYDPDTYTNSEYYDKTDVGFEFPFTDLEAYISEDHPDFSE